MFYQEALERAIKNYLAPDMMTALQTADSVELFSPQQTVRVPLYAGVDVALNKKLGTVTVTATSTHNNPDEWLHSRQVFTTKELFDSKNRANVIEYILEEMKRQLVHSFAGDELKKLINTTLLGE